MAENEVPKEAQPAQKITLTEREQEFLAQAWTCMKTTPEIDYNRLAETLGMTNPRSAANAWSAIKKKLFTGTPPPTPSKGGDSEKKRKRATPKKAAAGAAAAAAGGDGADDGQSVATPTKKQRSPRKKATPATSAPVKDQAEGENQAAKSEETNTEPEF
ncbi:hypothetical protein SODALDRAFT_353570 [Sodiomyces alkalinus F11]|uniref:Myb-like domain-containing protein n=1 Tax=Sodiomyces alkalinus (strain CBS 110278 / VKM F-3762 / F11) TaxID=1314773 RepID=A0A3N2PL21_SODAK|nr:hypothetical protein SODALDRAFT_353570 [Sodiomyces alkalinus F11]ROT35212.1 hypothetical protein SODALDRAFT_353570 [Sodiomyces alkalinus F11]